MTDYVLGFYLYAGPDRDRGDSSDVDVLLIEKTHPYWQKGKLNGLGGKIEPGEDPRQAMVREFKEECGLDTLPLDWRELIVLQKEDWRTIVFYLRDEGPKRPLARTTTDEVVMWCNPADPPPGAIDNLRWLCPLALQGRPGYRVYTPDPVDVILFCPSCFCIHEDKPDPKRGWTNPEHRSHECQACGCIWRPADVPTNGVRAVLTRGTKDTYP